MKVRKWLLLTFCRDTVARQLAEFPTLFTCPYRLVTIHFKRKGSLVVNNFICWKPFVVLPFSTVQSFDIILHGHEF